MKEYLKDIFPRIIRYSKNLDDLTVLTNKPWVMMSEDSSTREVWIFRKNNVLIVSRNGVVEEGSWEYIPEAESLYIKINNVKRLINKAFVDDVALLLRLDGGKDILALANENKITDTFNIDNYLNDNYIDDSNNKYLALNDNEETGILKEMTVEDRINEIKEEINSDLILIAISFPLILIGILLTIFNKEMFKFGIAILVGGTLIALGGLVKYLKSKEKLR